MNEIEREILATLHDLDEKVRAIQSAAPRPNLLPIFEKIDALAGRYVTSETVAPDGYQVTSLSTGGTGGIVGELFGMSRSYRRRVAIGRDGRTIELELPAPHRDSYGTVVPIGWIR